MEDSEFEVRSKIASSLNTAQQPRQQLLGLQELSKTHEQACKFVSLMSDISFPRCLSCLSLLRFEKMIRSFDRLSADRIFSETYDRITDQLLLQRLIVPSDRQRRSRTIETLSVARLCLGSSQFRMVSAVCLRQ
jgi:hypothetical protein